MISPYQLRTAGKTKRARFVALLLLAFVTWGTTAEVTHHHGVARRLDSVAGSNVSNQTPDLVTLESGDKQSTSNTSRSRAECLICQLHQNLSTTLVTQAPALAAAEAKSFRAPTALTLRLSEYRSDRSGRAPPSIL